LDPSSEWARIPSEWKTIFKKNLVFQKELVTEQAAQSKFAARYYDMDTYWRVFFPDRTVDLSVTPDELAQIRALRKVKCGGTKIDSLAPVTTLGLDDLEYLDCNHTNINSLDCLAAIPTLRTLEIEHTGVSDLSPIRSSAGLTQLYFSSTDVVDITPLADLPNLVNLDFNDTAVSDLTALEELGQLRTLVINGCKGVTNLESLGATESLVKLDISRTSVSDLHGLASHRHLQILVAGELDIDSIDVIADLPALESLYINNAGQPIDLGCLRSSPSLRALYIGGTEVRNADVILDIPSLEILFHSSLPTDLCEELHAERPQCAITSH